MVNSTNEFKRPMIPSPLPRQFPRSVAISYSVIKYLLRAYSQSITGLDSGNTKVSKYGLCLQRP